MIIEILKKKRGGRGSLGTFQEESNRSKEENIWGGLQVIKLNQELLITTRKHNVGET